MKLFTPAFTGVIPGPINGPFYAAWANLGKEWAIAGHHLDALDAVGDVRELLHTTRLSEQATTPAAR